ncbi:cytochrome c oxidase subunit 3 [Pigmentiphaga litoralis]|uniref:cytochrome-c oxidase n=1 Tax=Pigmentiphaga litoralis TaxID=516702 RepID=A0A7Y9ISB8_9BURK|nr:cytochrome c oxidase subunit 3 [Pigmentiphaga litoralis]NYE24718.1 cytochrome c oxidase subunit 3 [Pigmentiphaga litoralis]NYE81668.1 cytochrome c oxidase subunit 3 [Pigmentiphaga litoralis]
MSAGHSVESTEAPYYFVPAPSVHPATGSLALLFFGGGMVMWVNDIAMGPWVVLAGVLGFLFVLYQWFGDAIAESEGGMYSRRVDVSYRWSMSWFIFSEVMFFAAFFGALFYTRVFTTPWLGNFDHRQVLWPAFSAVWPNQGPAGVVEAFATVGPFWLPTINTALLLTSGITLTISHHALRENLRSKCITWLAITVLLGLTFVCVQAYEYYHLYTELNLRLTSGAYGSTFYLLTGFHGFHVCLGALMLAVVLRRLIKGHFTADQHFGFEGAAWYWHFVDVVWLGLYLFVYWF